MIPIQQALSSSIVKKLITTLTGIALVLFAIVHLAGNLTLLSPNHDLFNGYAAKLESLGLLGEVLKLAVAALFIFHIVNGIMLTISNKRARPIGYQSAKSKGGPSKSNFFSRNMPLTGLILGVFWIIHQKHFKFGPGIQDGYVTEIHGEKVRDLYRLVGEIFQDPLVVGFYCFVMILLWGHLKHGFWSAFQSLGAINPRTNRSIEIAGHVIALLLALGFLLLPLYLHFGLGGVIK